MRAVYAASNAGALPAVVSHGATLRAAPVDALTDFARADSQFSKNNQNQKQGWPMSLIARMEEELKAARLARDGDRRDALSLVLNALQAAQKELQRPLSDEEELQVLQRERKRRLEAAEAFRAGGREEQAEDEEYELEVLEEFMPEPLSEDELEEIIDDVISEVGATSIRDLGRVMAGVMHQVSGRADGSTVSQLVREKLA